MKKIIIWLIVICMLTVAVTTVASAKTGVGLSSPNVHSVTINKFPFHYSDTLRIYNTGDEKSVYTIKVDAPYPDVKEWVSLDKDVFTLAPDTSTVVTFSIDAEEGYTGSYSIKLTPGITPKETDVSGIFVYLALGTPFHFTVNVPKSVGDRSLGDRPATATPTQTSEIQEIAKDVSESESGIVMKWMGTPISLDMPSKVYLGDLVTITASFIGGGEPASMGLLIVSPSGEEYKLPRSTEFRFDEVGVWSVMVVIGDEVILGKPIQVQSKGIEAYAPYVVSAVLLTLLVVLLLKKRK